jgi:hypothetical protein
MIIAADCIIVMLTASIVRWLEVMMATVSVRIDKNLALQAEREARIQNRSNAKQIEYRAKIGKSISSKLSIADLFAVSIVDDTRILDNSSMDDPFRQNIVMKAGNHEAKADPLPERARDLLPA